ncbi:MAG: hypothetical protein KA072_04120 [Thermoanaerobaculaceae bacterium]|nr:hypothetical protein [Thermoanaerobaculaceae bacterium]MDI9622631.1 hypothetical protein [Acidobacteriota bacterium]NLH11669.1 hypothetical protein [Holophagae bacterium]HPW54620.1 hypothetical protein [Thermoanaerobaculaceae bacterium]
MRRSRWAILVIFGLLMTGVCLAQSSDPRTAQGQLGVCGGPTAWQAVGYLEFEVKITNADGVVQGPWYYRWGRRDGVLRMSGPWAGAGKLEVVVDIASRTGGGWVDGRQLLGARLTDASNWALQRFGEDILWLTFPLEWGSAGVTVTPGPEVTEANGTVYLSTEVRTPRGTWKVFLDRTTGRVVRSVLSGEGITPLTVSWDEWKDINGVLFAQKREIAETGEMVEVNVVRTLGQAPSDAF